MAYKPEYDEFNGIYRPLLLATIVEVYADSGYPTYLATASYPHAGNRITDTLITPCYGVALDYAEKRCPYIVTRAIMQSLPMGMQLDTEYLDTDGHTTVFKSIEQYGNKLIARDRFMDLRADGESRLD